MVVVAAAWCPPPVAAQVDTLCAYPPASFRPRRRLSLPAKLGRVSHSTPSAAPAYPPEPFYRRRALQRQMQADEGKAEAGMALLVDTKKHNLLHPPRTVSHSCTMACGSRVSKRFVQEHDRLLTQPTVDQFLPPAPFLAFASPPTRYPCPLTRHPRYQ